MTPIGTFLNGREPTRLRGLAFLALSDTGQVGTLSSTSDNGGGASESWTYGEDIPCRIDPLSSSEAIIAERLSSRSTHAITVPFGTTVTTNDRFAIDGRGTFEVTAVPDHTGANNTMTLHAAATT